jgi:hypothetical protein
MIESVGLAGLPITYNMGQTLVVARKSTFERESPTARESPAAPKSI